VLPAPTFVDVPQSGTVNTIGCCCCGCCRCNCSHCQTIFAQPMSCSKRRWRSYACRFHIALQLQMLQMLLLLLLVIAAFFLLLL